MSPALRIAGEALASAQWLTRERLVRWGLAGAAVSLGLLTLEAVAHATHGVTNGAGEHLARDFINYWSGAKLAARGEAARAYDIAFFHAYQQSTSTMRIKSTALAVGISWRRPMPGITTRWC
jgi:hypothetical protein